MTTMNKPIYVVTVKDFDDVDYSIIKVFQNKENAINFMKSKFIEAATDFKGKSFSDALLENKGELVSVDGFVGEEDVDMDIESYGIYDEDECYAHIRCYESIEDYEITINEVSTFED